MKKKELLKTTGLAILVMLLTTFLSNAQIPIQGLHSDHEGGIGWNADGTGPEQAATGHLHPFGWSNCGYYAASCDYDDIDSDPDAAVAHFLDDIKGFPLFELALATNGFTPGQVKLKMGLFSLKNDLEGEDWFTFNNGHHFNYFDGQYYIELNGESMISGYFSYGFYSYDEAVWNNWQMESGFSEPYDDASNSSIPVQSTVRSRQSESMEN